MDAAKRHKEEQIGLAEQELKQVKSEIRTDKLENSHQCSHRHSKRSWFSFRKWKDERAGAN